MKTRAAVLAMVMVAASVWAANELSVNTGVVYNKDGVSIQQSKSYTVSITDTPIASGNVPISTTGTMISFGSVTNAGAVMFINTTTNSWSVIKYGADTNNAPFRIDGGQAQIFGLTTNQIGAIATTNTPNLQYIIFSR